MPKPGEVKANALVEHDPVQPKQSAGQQQKMKLEDKKALLEKLTKTGVYSRQVSGDSYNDMAARFREYVKRDIAESETSA